MLGCVLAFESVSTWRQPTPPPLSMARTAPIGEVSDRICRLSPGRLRVAVDGFTAAGKTSFGHELAAAIRRRGRSTLRASMDDFKNPWREARELGYDRSAPKATTATLPTSHPRANCCSAPRARTAPAASCCALMTH
jgi:hypothetical protein